MYERSPEIITGREVENHKILVPEFILIEGSMYATKTGTLINRVDRQIRSGRTAILFKPDLDNRWGLQEEIGTHDGRKMIANKIPADNPFAMLEVINCCAEKVSVVGIDEIQFFAGGEKGVRNTVRYMVDKMGLIVYGAGLMTDFRGENFGEMSTLALESDEMIHVRAICVKCGNEASRTQRIVNGQPANYNDPVVMIGAEESYEARCRHCHDVPGKPSPEWFDGEITS